MPRILITGATGLIGRQLLPQLAQSGYDVHATRSRREVPADLAPLATWHTADLTEIKSIPSLIDRVAPTALMHLAWPALTGSFNHVSHWHFLSVSRELIRCFYERGGERVVVGGTCFEYDWSGGGFCVEDRTPLRASTLYGQCKNALREYVREAADTDGRSWAWGRIFFVYGPGQDRTRFVPAVIRSLLAHEPVACTEGLQVRDYLHSYDVAGALRHLLDSGFRGVCNIGSGERITLRDIASEIAAQIGGESLVRFGAKSTPPGEPAAILADITRLRNRLGWRPRFTLTSGLADMIASVRRETGVPVSA